MKVDAMSERRHPQRRRDLDELFARVRRIEIVLGFIAGASGLNLLKAFI